VRVIATFLACATLCSCGVFQDKYEYTTMYKLHKKHIIFNDHPGDCDYCTRDKAEQAKSMMAEKSIDLSTPIL